MKIATFSKTKVMISNTLDLRLLFISILLILFSSNSLMSQEENASNNNEETMIAIYDDVWLPFMESYRLLDIKKFKSIQSKNLTKVAIDRDLIQTKEVYFGEIEGFFNQFKQAKRQLDIKFSILSTAIGENDVYQTGYYLVGYRISDSDPFQPMGYGYFTVVLSKENGIWKISMDADKRAAIDEAEFRKSDLIYELN